MDFAFTAEVSLWGGISARMNNQLQNMNANSVFIVTIFILVVLLGRTPIIFIIISICDILL